jgi:hypothetical protein
MRALNPFDYAIVRIVPFVEREEFFNAGVILFCIQQKFLEARIHLDVTKVHAFALTSRAEEAQQRLDAIPKICSGDPAAGPIASLSQRARFHWLVAPRSTLVQVSAVHSGLCDDPEPVLDRLFREYVLPSSGEPSAESLP